MANNEKKTYWPHMILGFLLIAIILGYWTVKSAISLPVEESNDFMLKYQIADMNINEIMEKKIAFDNQYRIELVDAQTIAVKENVNSKVKQTDPIKLLYGANEFHYIVVDKNGNIVKDANMTFLLTRPHTQADDVMVNNLSYNGAVYTTKEIQILRPGRYTLELRTQIGASIGYLQTPAYLEDH
ncbi:MAG: hypothetical protein PHR75_07940 [Sulfurovum sp.]|nr:hypothetical protein [Sulfurovum sp.]MDD3602185.1 hypothetical protein [Sulfurovum sp.]